MKRRKNTISSSDSEIESSDSDDYPKASRKKIILSSSSEEEDEQSQHAIPVKNKVVSFPSYRRKESSESDSGGSSLDSSFIDDEDRTSENGDSSDSHESFEPPDPGLVRVRYSSVSSEDEDEVAYGKKLSESQVTSICRLDIAAIDADIRNHRYKLLKEKIQWIVDSYNTIKKSKDSEESEKYVNKDIKNKKEPRIKKRDRKHFKGEGFHSVLFVQEVQKAIPFLRDFGVRMSSSVIHAVVFHYRGNDEIFAVSTGAGWTVVEKYCDFSFSATVAARILSEKGAVESTKKGLVGTEVQSRKVHKTAQQENPFDLLEFCTNYTAEVKPTASIFKLARFQRKLTANEDKYEDPESDDDLERDEDGIPTQSPSKTTPPPSKKFPYRPVSNLKVIVNQRSIRIQTRLSAADRLSILDILSSIAKGDTTYDIYGQTEIDSSAHVKYLTPVDKGSRGDLNLRLSRIIHNALSDTSQDQSKVDELLNFEIIHKHFTRFMNGENFKVIYNNNETPSEWPARPPTLKEVVLALRDSSLMQFDPSEHVNRDEAFLKRLEKVKITFTENSSGHVLSDKLLSLVDGLLVSDEGGTVYWHVQGRWTLLGSVYLLTVHQEIMKFVRGSLMSPSTSEARQYQLYQLQKPWPTFEQIEENEDSNENESSRRCRFSRRFVNSFVEELAESPDIFVPRDSEGLFDFIRCPSQQNQSCASSSTSSGVLEEEKVILYFIIPSLNYEVVENGIRISSAIMQIRKAANTGRGRGVAGSELIKGKIKNIHDDLLENGNEVFKERFPTLEIFRTALAEATICVGIGRGVNVEDIHRHVSLERFVRCPEQISAHFIQDRLQKEAANDSILPKNLERAFCRNPRNDDFRRLSLKLLQEFRKGEFISSTKRLTAKILAVTKSSFKFPEKELSVPLRQFIYDTIIEGLQSKGFTLLARLALIRLERTLHETGCSVKLIDIS